MTGRGVAGAWWATARHAWRLPVAAVLHAVWWVLDWDARDVARAWARDIAAAKAAGADGRTLAALHDARTAAVTCRVTPVEVRALPVAVAAVATSAVAGALTVPAVVGLVAGVAALAVHLAAGGQGRGAAAGDALATVVATVVAAVTGAVVAVTGPLAVLVAVAGLVAGGHGLTVAGLAVVAVWPMGRAAVAMDLVAGVRPQVAGRPDEPAGGGRLDAAEVMAALAAARVPGVAKAVEAGHTARWAERPSPTGHGETGVLALPAGVTADAVAKLAGEVSSAMAIPPDQLRLGHAGRGHSAGHLRVTVLDEGRPDPGRWPLADGDRADLWALPIGVTPDGHPVAVQGVERSAAYGGMTDTGKSKAMRLQATAEALAGAELLIAAGKGGGDWEPLSGVASAYLASPDPAETARFVRDQLRRMHAEGRRRAGVYRAAGWERCGRDVLARPGLHFVALYVDESSEVFADPTHGPEITELATELVKLFPAYGLALRLATQTPDATSIPPAILKLLGLQAAFAVRDHHVTNAILGSGAHGRGWRPSELSQEHDQGTAWVVTGGSTGQLVHWYWVDSDLVREVAARVEPPTPIGPGVSRVDALQAVLGVIGSRDSGVRREDAWARLRVADPGTWGDTTRPQLEALVAVPSRSIRYGDEVRSGWSRSALEAALADEGVVAVVAPEHTGSVS